MQSNNIVNQKEFEMKHTWSSLIVIFLVCMAYYLAKN